MTKTKGNVLITGAVGNLGRAVVRRFSEDGYTVIATTMPGESLGEPAAAVHVFPVDLGDESNANTFFDSVQQRFESIDIALFLVGGFEMGEVGATTGEALRRMINLNFETAFFLSRRVFLRMLDQQNGGRLVFVGAKPGLEPEAGTRFVAYTLSKSMLFSWVRMLNAEADGKNVVSSVIVPGTIDTPANRKQMPSADFSKWVSPEQIAEVMAFITSPNASAVAGAVLKLYK